GSGGTSAPPPPSGRTPRPWGGPEQALATALFSMTSTSAPPPGRPPPSPTPRARTKLAPGPTLPPTTQGSGLRKRPGGPPPAGGGQPRARNPGRAGSAGRAA